MLEKFRTNLRGLALGITIVIGAIFALSGTGTLFIATPDSEAALVINGEKISERDVQLALITEKNRILSQNPDLDQALLDDTEIRPLATQQIIARQVIAQASKSQNLGVSSKLIGDLISGAEQFQTDGAFDQDKYRFSIRNQGYASSAKFVDMLKNQFLVQQFSQGIINTSFVTATELAALAAVTEQKRDYYYTRLPFQPFMDEVSVSEQEVADHYQQTLEQYLTQMQVKVQYIELNPDMLMASQPITEQQIQARFDLEAESAETQPSLRAAHILLEDESPELIKEIQEKINAGIDFADLAKQYSDDFASANNGGDLGYTSGSSFPEAFEVALAELEIGEVSSAVTTDAGVHLIKLLEVQESTFAFASQRDRIAQDLQKEAVEDQLVEKLELLKELSFNAENLDEVAQELELQALISDPFPESGGSGIAVFPAVVKAAYSPEVLEDGYSSEVLDLGDDRYMVIRLHEALPVRQKPLDEVYQQVEETLIASLAQQAIEAQSTKLLTRIKNGESVEEVAKSLGLDWQVVNDAIRGGVNTNSEINAYIFQLPSSADNPINEGFYTSNGDFVVVQLTEVTMGNFAAMGAEEKNMLRSIVEPAYSGREILSYQSTLINQAKIIQ